MPTKVYVAISDVSRTGDVVSDDTGFTYAATFSSLSAAIADATYGSRDISSTTGSNESPYFDVFYSYTEVVGISTGNFTFIDNWVVVRAAPSYEHSGLPNTGIKISNTIAYADKYLFSGNVLVLFLEFFSTGNGTGTGIRTLQLHGNAVGIGLISQADKRAFEFRYDTSANIPTAISCLAFNSQVGFYTESYNGGRQLNCVALNCTSRGFDSNSNGSALTTTINCLGLGNAEDFSTGLTNVLEASNNASSDGTAWGTNPTINLVPANEIENLAGLNPHLKAGNSIETSGLDLVVRGDISASNNKDIDGQPFTGWPIGCDQPGAFTVPLGITAYDAQTLLEIQGVDLYIYADIGGTLPQGTEISSGTSDVNGEINVTPEFTGVQPLIIQGRKATVQPFYQEGKSKGVLTGGGYSGSVYMISDQE